jgi:hypothetical protein
MVVPDLNVAGEDLLEHGLNFSISVWPIGRDEDNDA